MPSFWWRKVGKMLSLQCQNDHCIIVSCKTRQRDKSDPRGRFFCCLPFRIAKRQRGSAGARVAQGTTKVVPQARGVERRIEFGFIKEFF